LKLETMAPAGAAAGAEVESFAVLSLTKVSETRVGRTTFDYQFRVIGKNTGASGSPSWSATIVSTPAGTEVRSGSVTFPSTPLGEERSSLDLITLRIDRAVPFLSSSLGWKVEGAVQPPPPPPLLGIDADADGVRDDVQAFISSTYATEPRVVSALMQFAKGLQQAALTNSSEAIEKANALRMNAALCLVDRTSTTRAQQLLGAVRSIQLDTVERLRAEYAFRAALAGSVRTWEPPATEGSCE